ncbi:MAG: tetratricopeptide repeat protein [Flavobacteriales bacterium]|nr:tetratricopeptide repeat protein [Flavobacteriales bacterium]
MPEPLAARSALLGLVIIAASANAQVNLDSLRNVAADRTLPDSVRFLAYHDLVWDGYLFTEPDSAQAMGQWLQREARRKRNSKFEARASELIAASWYVRGDMRTALLHYDTALALHKRNHDDDGYADVITNAASMRSYLGEHALALSMYAEGLVIHERMQDSTSIANDLNAMGRVHMVRGDHVRAADLYMQSLRILELIGDKRGMSTGQANMGTLFQNQGDHAAAIGYFREGLRLAEELGDKHLIGKDLEVIGACLEELGDTAAAMGAYQKSLLLRAEMDDRHGLVNVKNRIGYLLNKQGKHANALALFEETIALAQGEELPWGMGSAWVGKGDALLAMGRTTEAMRASEAAEDAAQVAADVTLLRDASDLRYRALRALGRWHDALVAHEQTEIWNDSLLHEENQRAVLRNAYQYQFGKKVYADSLDHIFQAQKEAVRTERRMGAERSKRNLALGVGAILFLGLIGIWQRARLLRRTNTAILEAQARLMESERAREASEVRTRIATDVHDQLGSDLTKLVMLSSEAKAVAKSSTNELSVIADDIERVAGEANRSLGDIVWAIDPHHDSMAGLTERVRAHCERMLQWSKTQHTIDCGHEGPDRSLDPATKRDIYLMLREALNNAIKYAKARHIAVIFHTSATSVQFDVKDDGIGMEPRGTNGHGLKNMQQRAKRAGGNITVTTAPGEGTSIAFRIRLSST